MGTSTQSSDSTSSSTETVDTSKDQQQDSTEETSGQEQQQDTSKQGDQPSTDTTDKSGDSTDKPDPAKQALQADLHKERKEHKASKARVTELEQQVTELTPVKETLDAVQAKYDLQEQFLQAAGGPLGKALDSRSFTHDLFETDKDIADIVKAWHKANPSATTTALSSSAAEPSKGKVDPNVLLRAAAGK